MRDPYSVLGVPATASDGEIKKAYHRLAKELHPDLNPDDSVVAERFKEVSAAYSLVGDAAQRKRFDGGEIDADGQEKARYRYEYAGGRGGAGGPGGPGGPGGGFGGGGFNAEDVFGEFFSNMRGGNGGGGAYGGRARQQKGPDRSYKITVDFLDATKGATRRITLPDSRMLDVRIPAGIEDGKQIRLRGQGDPGPAGAGDALVEVSVRKHKQFRREGMDIHLDMPLDLASAVLGGKIEVPTIDGPVTMKIPKGTNSGKTLRLKGKGIKPPKAETGGNQYVHLQVTLPDPPDPELTALLETWAQSQIENDDEANQDQDSTTTENE
ncbi:MAG: J domain-containing protein [Rhodospirillaceae bacterium]|jgi:DnaJ-class molecular chaperone|nr:J domain-containing protein [Rhodospirillaceae bacterium]MBT4042816.1 J domain-containing protein [Rhodospirillaceae bacterium]MBT4689238.1 J domain-containing protein [Rhodospirillaceae bacterium]MBT5080435.1 J domain-containing protein [Rhodospirillaceae bacterium]MBT5523237.1 J domain-containing protein [Rhodospirillaceae bacterium]